MKSAINLQLIVKHYAKKILWRILIKKDFITYFFILNRAATSDLGLKLL
jgi:hypothetical protein